MKTLTNQQLDYLRACLYRSGATPTQASALLPLMAQEVEHYMWIGLPFASAVDKVELEADNSPVRYLREKHYDTLVMENESATQQPDLDDIVFAHRNRAYGAYDLRKTYNSALINAIVMTVGIVLLVLAVLNAVQRGEWIYVSWGGAAWVSGILLVGFAGLRFYLERVNSMQ
ncbi:hypothetical protein J2I47_25800 [Fibrella sp. HMF5335]|uniref:Uncharacterized protein n=1 Tax=Fibrella rubiginis TaxID=2817060 RepID=A0A939K805_9BACT|nr:hypothetical protein [Fibrella rubiginis]MBO0939986.1 hypothetical protein [Fibrella rubiginis]